MTTNYWLRVGIQIEKENGNINNAYEIALDNLRQDPDYYKGQEKQAPNVIFQGTAKAEGVTMKKKNSLARDLLADSVEVLFEGVGEMGLGSMTQGQTIILGKGASSTAMGSLEGNPAKWIGVNSDGTNKVKMGSVYMDLPASVSLAKASGQN